MSLSQKTARTPTHVRVTPNGRIVIPADVRKRLGVQEGGDLVLEETEFGVQLTNFRQRVARARRLFEASQTGKPGITVDGFIAEKRADAAREKY